MAYTGTDGFFNECMMLSSSIDAVKRAHYDSRVGADRKAEGAFDDALYSPGNFEGIGRSEEERRGKSWVPFTPM